MSDRSTTISRTQLLYGLSIALAALIGFLMADPMRYSSMAVLGAIGGVLVWPLVVKWHHILLVASLNSVFMLSFLPGNLPIWALLTASGFLLVVLNRCLDREVTLFHPGGVGWSLVALAFVVVVTAACRGGVGLKALGSDAHGGRKYIMILLAIAAYFVLVAQPVPRRRLALYVGLFFLMGVTQMLSHALYLAGGKFYWAYYFVSVEPAIGQAAMDWQVAGGGAFRSTAFADAASGVCAWILATRGIRGVLDLRRPWPFLVSVLCLGLGMLGGFRSFVLGILLTYVVMFFVEGLHRTWYLGVVLAILLAGGGLTFTFVDRLPTSIQRSLSFLPIKVDPVVRQDAESSLEWRYQMWDLLRPEIPRYLFLGKGFAIDPGAMQVSHFNAQFGYGIQAEWAILSGDYHNGPLSVLIPFGIFGALAFLWFLVAATLRLRQHCLRPHEDRQLQHINRALFTLFIVHIIFFLFLFGDLSSGLVKLVFLVGLAECFNAPAAAPAAVADESAVVGDFVFEREESL
jgi:hypothetical protein